jgi:K+-transporting ATPase ATPase C chain
MLSSSLRPALVVLGIFTLLTGLGYPLLLTGISKVAFADRAAGSLIFKDSKPIGSALIGQNFSAPEYFWGRPSATGTMPYNPLASAGSNQGPLNPALIDAVKARIETLHGADPGNTIAIPIDLVTASASGLDPHISVAAARYQLARVARARQIEVATLQGLVEKYTQTPWLGLFGEPRVNVLELNLALDEIGS